MKIFKKNIPLFFSIVLVLSLLVKFFVYKTCPTIFVNLGLKKTQFDQLKKSVENFVKDYSGFVSVYIKDLNNGQTVLINENKKVPAASIIKIPIMSTIYYLNEIGKLSLEEELVYKKKHRCSGSGKIKFLPYHTKFKLKDLVKLMITESDNIATNIITERVGLVTLNHIFKETFGLKATNMNRYIMDLKLRDKGIENYTTAKEIGLMLENIYRGKLVSRNASLEMLKILMKQKATDRIPKYLPKEIVVAHKTGLMRDSCHDAGIVFTNKGNFVIVVLTQKLNTTIAKNVIAEIAYKTYSVYQ